MKAAKYFELIKGEDFLFDQKDDYVDNQKLFD